MKRVILIIAWGVCIFGILLGCGSLRTPLLLAPLEKALVFPRIPYPLGNWEPENLENEDAWFHAADGTKLHGWFVDHPQPRAVALFCHGSAGNITSRTNVLRELHDRHGLAVMAFDYRGYGRSEGDPNEKGVLSDARAARAWLARRTGVAESDILLIGHSLGGGVAVELAAHDGTRGLVLASTFTSLPDVAVSHAPWLEAHSLMTHRLNSLATITGYHGPLLQTHGDADKTVPYQLGRQLHEAAPGPKRFITIPGGNHNDFWDEACHQAIDEFLDSLDAAAPAGQAAPIAQTAEDRLRRLPAF